MQIYTINKLKASSAHYKQVSFLKNAFAGHENEYAFIPFSGSGIFLKLMYVTVRK
jgi:hypothetical protein